MFRTCLFVLLTILSLSGCTPRALAVSAGSTETTEENTVATAHPPAGQIAKIVTLVATEGSTLMPPGQAVLEVTESETGKSIEVTVGTSIVIHLTGQPSTGYTWLVENVDKAILVQDGEPQYMATDQLSGGKEALVWTFKCASAGTTSLKLIYARPFEKSQPPLKTFELAVQVINR